MWEQKWSAGGAVEDIARIRGVANDTHAWPEVFGAGVWSEIEKAL